MEAHSSVSILFFEYWKNIRFPPRFLKKSYTLEKILQMSAAKSSPHRFQKTPSFPSNSLFEYLEAFITEVVTAVLLELESQQMAQLLFLL